MNSFTAVWLSPNQAPLAPNFPGNFTRSVAMNDAGTLVENVWNFGSTVGDQVWRWSPMMSQAQEITVPHRGSRVAGLNSAGYAVGRTTDANPVAVRWNPAGVATLLPTFSGPSAGEAINWRGDVLGVSGLGTTIWYADGRFAAVTGLPQQRTIVGWNDAGRIVGIDQATHRSWTFYQGVLTYLPYPSSDLGYPVVSGVNACGSIVGQRYAADGTVGGYLWTQSGMTMVCDLPPSSMPTR
jgi:hypothetical protein